MNKMCVIDGCNNRHRGLGFCSKHLQRYKKYGDALYPNMIGKNSESLKNLKPSNRKGQKLSSYTKNKISAGLIGHKTSLKGNKWPLLRRQAQIKISARLKVSHKNKKLFSRDGSEYPDEWCNIRKIIYERDGWVCQECGCKCHSKDYRIKKNRIQCHHIDYNITNIDSCNLITLCASCHMKTNFKREDWKTYFNNKMKGKKIS